MIDRGDEEGSALKFFSLSRRHPVPAISERQWRDIAGVRKQQQDRLDPSYLAEWAERLKVLDVWNQICNEAATE